MKKQNKFIILSMFLLISINFVSAQSIKCFSKATLTASEFSSSDVFVNPTHRYFIINYYEEGKEDAKGRNIFIEILNWFKHFLKPQFTITEKVCEEEIDIIKTQNAINEKQSKIQYLMNMMILKKKTNESYDEEMIAFDEIFTDFVEPITYSSCTDEPRDEIEYQELDIKSQIDCIPNWHCSPFLSEKEFDECDKKLEKAFEYCKNDSNFMVIKNIPASSLSEEWLNENAEECLIDERYWVSVDEFGIIKEGECSKYKIGNYTITRK